MPSLGDILHTQFLLDIPKPSDSFASTTVIITGANRGLAKEIAKHMICLGASQVILGCRSQARGNEAKSEIEAFSGCSPDIIQA
ncbi:putative retinol dehydrogenase 12 [Diaporthe ampelina]|uniref:Putative retinol dehydrogenase 12 n=1 Tax=Diaporthe ampelina TaxID=1214573 RepID=A0A0G2F7F6_9PEZI|nr:putative retinol dehydrogenase 12 [Diaporthe ampelina]